MEAAGLGIFMVSAGLFAVLLEHPDSAVRQALDSPLLRRTVMGLIMGVAAIGIIYSPWGKQSGAHINPAVTLTFYRLGKVSLPDAVFYALAQFLGGLAGVVLIARLIGEQIAHPAVRYVVTVPGAPGVAVAFWAELGISFGLMLSILIATNREKLAPLTGVFAGTLVALYIIVEAPYSGMSINPARTFASALPAKLWTAFWIYLTAPPLGMLAAAQIYQFFSSRHELACAKLHHRNDKRCIHCGANMSES